jgi:hemoglobin
MTDAISPRRARIVEAMTRDTGITEEIIKDLVHHFYGLVRQDPLIGPVFNERISDWDPHLARMCSFWSSVALMSGTYHGQPMVMHAPLPVSGAHFDRWLELFAVATQEVCSPEAATFFMDRASRIAESLEMGIAGARGEMLRRGERLSPVESGA